MTFPRQTSGGDINLGYAISFGFIAKFPVTGGLYDASQLPPKLIAVEANGQMVVKQRRLNCRIETQTEVENK
jgi:hypothetical protein